MCWSRKPQGPRASSRVEWSPGTKRMRGYWDLEGEATAWRERRDLWWRHPASLWLSFRRKLGRIIPFVIQITCLVYIKITYQERAQDAIAVISMEYSCGIEQDGTRVGRNLEKQKKASSPRYKIVHEDVCRHDFLGLVFIERVV